MFLSDARQTLVHFERTLRTARRNQAGDHGHLIVGYSHLATSIRLTNGLRAFQQFHPGVQVEMDVVATDLLMRRLTDGITDIAFLLQHETVSNPLICQQTVWSTQIGLVVPHSFERQEVYLRELDKIPLVLGVWENWRPYRSFLDSVFSREGVRMNVVDQAWDVQVIFQRVMDGVGYTIYPLTVENVLPAKLRLIPIVDLNASIAITMAWNSRSETALLREFRQRFVAEKDSIASG